MTREYEPVKTRKKEPIRLPPKPNIGIKHMKELGPLRRLRYSNLPDFVNPDGMEPLGTVLVDELGDYLERYKKDRDPKVIKTIMTILSKLILRMLHQEIRKYTALKHTDIPELYNASFICLHQAAIAFDVSKSSIYSFPRYLQGYIKKEVQRTIRWGIKYVQCELDGKKMNFDVPEETAIDKAQMDILKKLDVREAMRSIVETGQVGKENMEMFKMKYVEGYGYREIADKKGLTFSTVEHRIRKAKGLFKHELSIYDIKGSK